MKRKQGRGLILRGYQVVVRLFILSLLCLFIMGSMLEASVTKSKTYTARITAANYRSRINCQGKNLRKLAARYGNICAVEQGTIPLYSKVYIPAINKTYTAVDYMPRKSTNKHRRRANKRGITIELCLDRYKDVPTKKLKHYDLDITEVRAIK